MKQINVLTFGAITDITGNNNFVVKDVESTDVLKMQLEEQYPQLKTINYAIAVDKQIITADTSLQHNSTVAILPPFSGG